MNESPCSVPAETAATLVDGIISRLKERGMRRTPALHALLNLMAEEHRPTTLAELASRPGLLDHDQATIYRLVDKLEEAGAVRRLGLQGGRSHFELLVPGHHHDYLVCRDCGRLEEAPIDCQLCDVETQLATTSGWRDLTHELEFHGRCPACSEKSSHAE
ncbi:MAG: Fur family transcriptional regulator [Verrucomicrobiales bacterium]